jgi:hypothetical protein
MKPVKRCRARLGDLQAATQYDTDSVGDLSNVAVGAKAAIYSQIDIEL